MSKASPTLVCNALIRTHHIRSRKKIAALKAAANNYQCSILLKSDGRAPGIMYVEAASESKVKMWVEAVRRLHYLNYILVSAPAASTERTANSLLRPGDVVEVETVKEFAEKIHEMGITDWWRKAMGYTSNG